MASEFEDSYDAWLEGREEHATDALIEERLGDWELSSPVMVEEDSCLADAIATMKDRHVGCVIIGSGPRGMVGIFSERDLLTRVSLKGVDEKTAPVSSFMTHAPECLHRDDSIAQALHLMIREGFRHVPVLDDNDALIGVFSMRDVARFVAELFPKEIHNAPPTGPTRPPTRYGG